MSIVAGLVKDYVELYLMLDRMLAGEHGNARLRREFAQTGKLFLDRHVELADAPYSAAPGSDFALLRANPELRKQVARVISGFAVNERVADMIPGLGQGRGQEMNKVAELLNSPQRLRMLRLIRNPAMAELGGNAHVRALLPADVLAALDRLNALDAKKPSLDTLDINTRLRLVRDAIAAPESGGGMLSNMFKRAASALVPDMVLRQINDMAEQAYKKAQDDLDQALQARAAKAGPSAPRP